MRVLPLIFIISGLALAACERTATESATYTPPDTPGGRYCTSQCSKAHNYCQEDCSLKQRECTTKIQAQALMDYEKYMSDNFLHSNAREARVRDFENLDPCDESFKSCARSCEPPYQSCYENCGGSVSTTTSCQFLCF